MPAISITPTLQLETSEITISQIRAQGAGGQNVNKVSSAVQLRFEIPASSLPQQIKTRLLSRADSRINKEGTVIIKAQNHRTFERNREEATERLCSLIRLATIEPKRRKPTRPSRASRERRLENKARTSRRKELRKKIF